MNIGIVTTWFERGASYVSKQYRDILDNEHDVFIYARGGEKYAIENGDWDSSQVTWAKKIPLHMPMSIDLDDFKKWIIHNNIEIVFFNEQQWWDPVILCNKMGIKTGAYVDYYTKETAPFFGLYDFLICNTKRHYQVFSWHAQAIYIPWGTDLDLFKPRTVSPVKKNFITFFHSCGVSPERKGTDLLLQAFANLKGETQLVIHTQVDLKKKLENLSDLIYELEQKERLRIINETVSAPGLYHLGDVYVYPSRLDGIGLTVPEALACGLPVIVPDCPPMNEFIDPKTCTVVEIKKYNLREDAYYWPMGEVDIEKLTISMQKYVDSREKNLLYKTNARKFAEENLDWKKNSVELPGLFTNFRTIPLEEKLCLIKDVVQYENNRSNLITKVYRKFPFFLKPFSWFWLLIKLFYIQR